MGLDMLVVIFLLKLRNLLNDTFPSKKVEESDDYDMMGTYQGMDWIPPEPKKKPDLRIVK